MSSILSNKGVTQRNFKLSAFIKCLLSLHGTRGMDYLKMNNSRSIVVKKSQFCNGCGGVEDRIAKQINGNIL